MEQTQNRLTEGKILGSLIGFMLPVLAALFLQTMYGAVDLMVVGQFGGEHADVFVSAVATGSHLMFTVTFIVAGLGMGLTIAIGRCVGAGKREEAGEIIGSGIWLFTALTVVLTVLMLVFAEPIARLMKAPERAFADTVRYVVICSAGMIFIVAYNMLGSIFRGGGDSKLPLITVAIACTVNIAADVLLVAVFKMGAAGAAVATVFAQALSVALSLLIMRRRRLPFAFSRKSLRPNGGHIKEILRLGVPISLQDLLVNLSFLVITAIINSLGVTASAGVGVADKLCGFLMLISMAFMQAMSAFVAQNMGAGKPERARKALRYGIAASLAVGVVIGAVTFFRGDLLAGIFAKDREIIDAAADYLRAYSIDCVLTAFLFCFLGYFNGLGSTTFVMIQGLVGAFFVRIPVAWLMSRETPVSLFHIGLSTPASSFVQIVLCLVFYAALKRRGGREGGSLPEAEPKPGE